MVLERSVKPSELKKLQDDYSVDMAREGIEERRRGLMVIKKSSLPSKAHKRKNAILNWQVNNNGNWITKLDADKYKKGAVASWLVRSTSK